MKHTVTRDSAVVYSVGLMKLADLRAVTGQTPVDLPLCGLGLYYKHAQKTDKLHG